MNPLAPIDPWPALERWLNHGEGAQLSDKELEERLRYPDGIEALIEALNAAAR